jgi:hypothetical protein
MKLELTFGRSAITALLIVSGWNIADARDATAHRHAQAAAQEQKSFDEFVERLAAQWMRARPAAAQNVLVAESGWYEGDPKGHLGQLSAVLFRARRLVVDTGLHAKHWTRQQAIDYGIQPSEVDRYVVWPGQACA